MNAGIVVIASLISAAVTYLLMLFLGKARGNLSSAEEIIRAKEESLNQRLLDKDEACRALIKNKEEACRAIIEAKTADCEKIIRDKNEQIEKLIEAKERAFAETVKTLREQFANIAEQKLKSSTEGLSEINQKRISEIIKPFQDEIDKFRQAFEANTQQQVVNKASFDQAITDLGKRVCKSNSGSGLSFACRGGIYRGNKHKLAALTLTVGEEIVVYLCLVFAVLLKIIIRNIKLCGNFVYMLHFALLCNFYIG
jgi:hypothetical protein